MIKCRISLRPSIARTRWERIFQFPGRDPRAGSRHAAVYGNTRWFMRPSFGLKTGIVEFKGLAGTVSLAK